MYASLYHDYEKTFIRMLCFNVCKDRHHWWHNAFLPRTLSSNWKKLQCLFENTVFLAGVKLKLSIPRSALHRTSDMLKLSLIYMFN